MKKLALESSILGNAKDGISSTLGVKVEAKRVVWELC